MQGLRIRFMSYVTTLSEALRIPRHIFSARWTCKCSPGIVIYNGSILLLCTFDISTLSCVSFWSALLLHASIHSVRATGNLLRSSEQFTLEQQQVYEIPWLYISVEGTRSSSESLVIARLKRIVVHLLAVVALRLVHSLEDGDELLS